MSGPQKDWRNLVIALLVGALTGGIGGLGVFHYTSPWTRERAAVMADLENTKERTGRLEVDFSKFQREIRDELAGIQTKLAVLIDRQENESKR